MLLKMTSLNRREKCEHVKHLNTMYNMTNFHCTDQYLMFPKVSNCSLIWKKAFSSTS